MNRPENMTPDEAEIWQRMELHGEELVRDMGAAMMQAERLPEWMQEAAVNMLCDKLADARALAARLQQLAVALDGGVLVTADGVEVELYGSGGNA